MQAINDEMIDTKIYFLSSSQTISMADEWYEHSSPDHFWFSWRLRILLRDIAQVGLQKDESLNVLDVGCGNGTFVKQLEQTTAWDVDACDLNPFALEQFRCNRGNRYLYDITEQQKQFRNRYDIVFLLDVVEHIETPNTFITSAMWHVKTNGFLVINLPAYNFFYSDFDRVMGHYRRYSKKTLIRAVSHLEEVDAKLVCYWGCPMWPMLVCRKYFFKKFDDKKKCIAKGILLPPFCKGFTLWMIWLLSLFDELFRPITNIFGTSVLGVWQKSPKHIDDI